MKTNKKYYILYKVIKDNDNNIIDASYNYEFTTYEEIRDYLHCTNRDIKNITHNNIDNFNNIKTLKNTYFIIKEEA